MKRLLLMGVLLVPALSLLCAQETEKPQTNVYAIVKAGDGRIQVIRAKEVEKKDPALFITDEEGKKNARQLNMLIDVIPFYVDEDAELPDENITKILAQYDNLMQNYAELRKHLSADRVKYQAVIEERKLQQEEKTKQKEQLLRDFMAEQFDNEAEYQLEALTAKVSAGEQLKAEYADEAGAISEYLRPWVARQALLKEGKVKFEGEWRSKAEIAEIHKQRQEEKMKLFIESVKPVSVSNTVATQQTMTIVIVFLVISALVALFSFYYAVFQSKVGGFLEFIMLLVSVVFMGFYAFYAWRILNAPGLLVEHILAKNDKAALEEVSFDKIYQLLYISKGDVMKDLRRSDFAVMLSDAEINAAVDKLIAFKQETVSGSLGLTMEKLRFYATPTKLQFLQQTSCMGKNFLLRYDLYFQTSGDVTTFYKCDVFVGDTALPSAVGNRLWRELFSTIQAVTKGFNISNSYQFQKIEDGKVTVGYVMPGS